MESHRRLGRLFHACLPVPPEPRHIHARLLRAPQPLSDTVSGRFQYIHDRLC